MSGIGNFIRIIIFLNYVWPLFSILLFIFCLSIAILSKRLYWSIHLFVITTPYIMVFYTYSTLCCTGYIYFTYFGLRFDQLNDQIKAIIPNGKWMIIYPRREKMFQLINEHNWLSLQIDKMNLMVRRWTSAFFVCFTLI